MCPCAKDSEDPVRKIIRTGKIERMASSLVDRTETSFIVRGSAGYEQFQMALHQAAPDLAALLTCASRVSGEGPGIGFSSIGCEPESPRSALSRPVR
jgi:hypothetical protein